MEFEERPLLNGPELALALLRAAAGGAATIEDAASLLEGELGRVGESPPPDPAETLAHLDRARIHLAAAHLLETVDNCRFRITPRGRAVLHSHPDGIDDTVLMGFPEFRLWLERAASAHVPADANSLEFMRGWLARDEGQDLAGNPYAPDTARHAAWADGWLEAQRRGREGA